MAEENTPEEKPTTKKKIKRIVSAFFLIILFGIIGIFYMGATLFGSNKPRAYNSNARATLQNMYLVCQKYWSDKGSDKECLVNVLTSKEYGDAFIPEIYGQGNSPEGTEINRTICVDSRGSQENFTATARHHKSSTEYSINKKGGITPDWTTPPNFKWYKQDDLNAKDC